VIEQMLIRKYISLVSDESVHYVRTCYHYNRVPISYIGYH
jgi:hypothetical protein